VRKTRETRVEVRNDATEAFSLRVASLPQGFEFEPQELELAPGEAVTALARFLPIAERDCEGAIEFDPHRLTIPVRGRWDIGFEDDEDAFHVHEARVDGLVHLEPDQVHRIEAELLPLASPGQSRRLSALLAIHHSRQGERTPVEVVAAPWSPFPVTLVEGPVFPETPLGQPSIAFLEVHSQNLPDGFPAAHVLGLPELRQAGPAQLTWTGPSSRMASISFLLAPAEEAVLRGTIEVELAPSLPEPLLLDVEATAVGACEEPCDWPSIDCQGWEIVPPRASPPYRVRALAEPSSEELECLWVQQSGTTTHYLSATQGCQEAITWILEGDVVEVLARDNEGRAAVCSQTYVREEEPPAGET